MNKQLDHFEEMLKKEFREERTLDTALIHETGLKIRLETQNKEREKMKLNKKPLGIAATIGLTFLLTGVTALAAWRMLTPSEVADIFENRDLAIAFESESAIHINETAYSEGYRFTLMSIVSGADLTDTPIYIDGYVQVDRSYVVVAIERVDGTDMIESSTHLLVSPYIHGFAPWQVNIASLGLDAGGGHREIIVDGVLYRLIETGNIEVFANHGVYLGISAGTFSAFAFDSETGTITLNANFDGPAVLFDLPLAFELANENRVQEILDEIFYEEEFAESNLPVEDDCIRFSSKTIRIDEDGNEVVTTLEDDMNFVLMSYDELADFLAARIEKHIANDEPDTVIQGARRDRNNRLTMMRTYNIEFAQVWYDNDRVSVQLINPDYAHYFECE